jgi:hypothetical protein
MKRCPYRTQEVTRSERGNFFEDTIKQTSFLPCYREECGFWDEENERCSLASRNKKEKINGTIY